MNFDLNINNYNLSELEEMFELPNDYNQNLIEMKESRLRQNIQSNTSIQVTLKPKILDFITKVKSYIMDNYKKNTETSETIKKTYSNIYNLDDKLQPSETIADGGTFIIKKPKTPYGQSRPSEFYEGVLNPLANRILRQNLNIDTRFRENYYTTLASDFHFDLPIRFNEVVSMQLSAIEFPTTFYCISRIFGNNYFSIVIKGVREIIIVPDGTYTNNGMQLCLNAIMSEYANETDEILQLFQYICFKIDDTLDSGSGRMFVAVSTDYPSEDIFDFTLEFDHTIVGEDDYNTPLPLKLGWLFGFRKGIYFGDMRYYSEGIVDLKGLRYIYLVVDDFNNNVNNGFYGAFTTSLLNKNILARITLFGNLFNNIMSQNNLSLITTARQYFGPVVIQKMKIQLLDEYGRVIDLHNMDYSFCLTLQTIYDL